MRAWDMQACWHTDCSTGLMLEGVIRIQHREKTQVYAVWPEPSRSTRLLSSSSWYYSATPVHSHTYCQSFFFLVRAQVKSWVSQDKSKFGLTAFEHYAFLAVRPAWCLWMLVWSGQSVTTIQIEMMKIKKRINLTDFYCSTTMTLTFLFLGDMATIG